MLDTLLIAGFALGSFVAIAWLALYPRDPANGVAVVFAPWLASDQAMLNATDAGARFIRFGAYPFIVVVKPDKPDYLAAVRQHGALLVLDPEALAACLGTARS